MSISILVKSCEAACHELTPVVRALYGMMNESIKTEKADKSIFTVADGLVQNLVSETLLGNTGVAIVGEEDVPVEIAAKPYKVDNLVVPTEVEALLDGCLTKLKDIRSTLSGTDFSGKDITAFIDPIDGTREFASGKGEQCSICIGFAQAGRPVGGIVYRPLSEPPTWCAAVKSENYLSEKLQFREKVSGETERRLLTSNGGISAYMQAVIDAANLSRVKTGGAGNKVLMLIEGHGDIYFQDRGLSRWDTCAAEALLEAKGGCLAKLTSLWDAETIGYQYTKGEANLDFTEGQAALTPYNATVKVDKEVKQMATKVDQVKPYSNLAGLFAVTDSADIAPLRKLLVDVAAQVKPSYD